VEVGGFVTRPVQALALVLDAGLSARASTPARAIFSAAIDMDVLLRGLAAPALQAVTLTLECRRTKCQR